MKKFLAKASKSFAFPLLSPDGTLGNAKPLNSVPGQSASAAGLQVGLSFPCIPHPCPHDHLALLVSKDGLHIRPHIPGSPPLPYSCLRISWGKSNKIEQLEKLEEDDLDWAEGVVVYGIGGMVELFTCVWFELMSTLSSDEWE